MSSPQETTLDREFLEIALAEARLGLEEGGLPIGAVLVADGRILARGRNRRVQLGSAVRHAEIDAIEIAGRQTTRVYSRATMYTTLSPCPMCAGAILLFGIPRVVMGENRNQKGPEDLLRQNGVEIVNLDSEACAALLRDYIRTHREVWEEDAGLADR